MDFGVLGPLRVESIAGRVEIRGAKERLLLARLVAAGGRVVPTGVLVETLWGEEPPRSATKSLQVFVARLRNALAPHQEGDPALIVTEGPGYRLAVDQGQVDAGRFVRLTELGRGALDQGEPAGAARSLDEALALWRGPAYAGFEEADFAAAEALRLEELRLVATEDLQAALLHLGRHAEAVPQLEALVREHPLRERAWELLVTALYRAGRPGEALAAFDRARVHLAEELGVDPGPALRAVHARVLAHDPALRREPGPPRLPTGLRPAPEPPGLLGRDVELGRLLEIWHGAVRGRRGAVVVRGPRGGGGTALAAALAQVVLRAGGQVLLVTAEGTTRAGAAGTHPSTGDAPTLLVADHVEPEVASVPGVTLTVRLASHLAPVPAGVPALDLTPLGRADALRLVTAYLHDEGAEEVRDRVLGTSGGWPGALHELARDVAHDRAARRVRVAAAAALATSTDLAATRGELEDGIEALRGDHLADEPAPPTECPWRGLEAYDVEDARWYAGRDRLVAEILARLAGNRLVALVGASGSGKSSALRAGVIAALGDDVLPGSGGWRTVVLRPGLHPLAELARHALGREREHGLRVGDEPERVVVAVDQFEEVWTVCADAEERTRFLDLLGDLATDPLSAVTVILAVRADYAPSLAEHPRLRALVGDGAVLVGPLTPAEVRRAVERPAAAAGLVLDDGLAETVVSDAGQEPGLLPLLSTAMAELWSRRDGNRLGYAEYVALGGLDGAIATRAEEVFAELSAAQRHAARSVLLRLAGPGEGGGVTRRRVPIAELEALPDAEVPAVVEELVAARLLTRGGDAVEVAHEALFREWPRLRGWLAEDAAGRAVQRRLAVAAAEWEAEGREPSQLWTGARLASALEIASTRPEELTGVERDFLDAGRAAVDSERRAAEERAAATVRQNRRLRRWILGTSLLLVLALVAGALAWGAQRQAAAAGQTARARSLAAAALNVEQSDLALLSAVQATRLDPDTDTYGALLTLLSRQPAVVHRVRAHERFLRMGVSADGRTVFVSENTDRVRALDAESGRTVWEGRAARGTMASSLTATPDGELLLVTLRPYDEDVGGLAALSARDGSVVWSSTGSDLSGAARGLRPEALAGAFVDGAWVVLTASHVLRVDPADGTVLEAVRWPAEVAGPADLERVWPDGRVSWWDGSAESVVFDPASRSVRTLEGTPLDVSPDGTLVLVSDQDEVLRLVDATTLQDASPGVQGGPGYSATWHPDGTRLFVGGIDEILVLETPRLRIIDRLTGHSGAVLGVGVAGEGEDLLWTAGRDGTALGLDLSSTRTPVSTRMAQIGPLLGRAAPAAGLGVWLRMGTNAPDTAHVAELPSGRDLGELTPDVSGVEPPLDRAEARHVTAIGIDPVGRYALAAVGWFREDVGILTDTGLLAVFDARTREQAALVPLPWPADAVAAWGDRAVVSGSGGYAVVDLTTGAALGGPRELPLASWQPMPAADAVFSRDGSRGAFGRGAQVVVVDLSTGDVTLTIAVEPPAEERADQGSVQGLGFSADGSVLVVGTSKGRVGFWSTTTGEQVAPQREVVGGFVVDVEVSPDGRTVATLGSDGDTILWDPATWRPFGLPVTDTGLWGWLTFSADSRRLSVFFEDGQVVDLSVDRQEWVDAACSAAGRDLTPDEARQLQLPEDDREPVCPGA
ncbi:BTAD domain-containing putative transcriptional regulator [Ornithinimicrobium tianjinense]|uniref:nSTAND1 domain-containing NTPase n=1 Tax=Ornithinimicrobium tianjinense TaxID=1195761 RepID=UPI00166C8999|nr:BTAD domain-containing putative transcriptional regulator [Ornithinimicrobium tianjinense]